MGDKEQNWNRVSITDGKARDSRLTFYEDEPGNKTENYLDKDFGMNPKVARTMNQSRISIDDEEIQGCLALKISAADLKIDQGSVKNLFVQFSYKNMINKTKILYNDDNQPQWNHVFMLLVSNDSKKEKITFKLLDHKRRENIVLGQCHPIKIDDLMNKQSGEPFKLQLYRNQKYLGSLKVKCTYKEPKEGQDFQKFQNQLQKSVKKELSMGRNSNKNNESMLMIPNTSQDIFLNKSNSTPGELKANFSIEDSTIIVDRKCSVKIPYLETDQKTEKKRKKQSQSDDLNMEPPSYSKLIQQIEENHPMDPYTKKPFKMRDRITVKDFSKRLFDAFYIYKMTQWISRTKKLMLKKIGMGKKILIEKPETLKDIQESSTDSDDENGGITLASLKLGDGSALYIQTMKSLSVMFVFLSLLNAPLFLIFKNNTHENKYNLDNIFKYFTLGNLGNTNPICGHSVLDIPLENGTFLNYTEHGLDEPMRLECEEGAYMNEIKNFGFLYKIEQARNQPSSG